MKAAKYFMVLLLWLCANNINATTPPIVAAEYYFDNDPGLGNGISIPVNTVDTFFNFSGNISLPALSLGIHKIFIRAKNANGLWSLAESRIFLVHPAGSATTGLLAAEYFFDSDPGFGNGISIPVTASDSLHFNGSIGIPSSLTNGMHRLFLRTKDNNGQWSLTEQRLFIAFNAASAFASNVTAAEYFFDADPGPGNATALALTPSASVQFNNNILLPASLTPGIHKLILRTKDDNDRWSLAEQRIFIAFSTASGTSQLTAAEYFFDNDPGLGNGTAINITPGNPLHFNGVILLPASLSTGAHTLLIRTKDNNGQWSLSEKRIFGAFSNANNATAITAAEFFIDSDPGPGNGIPVPVSNPGSTISQNSAITLPAFTTGIHKIFLRTKDNNNTWSQAEPRQMTGIGSSSVAISPAEPVCLNAGANILLTANITGGPWTIQWYKNFSEIPGANNTAFTASSKGIYTIIISSGANSQSGTVIVNEASTFSTSYTQPVCPGRAIELSVSNYLQAGSWSTGDTAKHITVHPLVTTTYSVTGTDINGCPVNFSLLAEVMINVPQLIKATASQPVQGDINVRTPVTLSWTPGQNSNGFELFLWKAGENRPLNGENMNLSLQKTINSLLPQQQYFWQIRSHSFCDTLYSDTATFTTNFPDLKADYISVSPQTFTNSAINVSWRIKNISATANTGNTTWTDRVWISLDTIGGNGADVNLGTYNNQSYLNAGDAYLQQKTISIGSNFIGTYYIIVQSDYGNNVPEISKANNYAFDTINISPEPTPDLKVISLGSPSNAFSGDSITVTYTIENDGQLPTDSVLWADEIFISRLASFNADSAVSLGSFSSRNFDLIPVYYFNPLQGFYLDHYNKKVFSLKEDSVYTAQSKVKIPATFLSGNYFIYVKTDANNKITENAFESNNIEKSPVVLSLTQLPPSDLIVDSLQNPSVAYSGQPVTVTWKVKNQGAAITNQSAWTDKVYINTSNSLTGATLLGTKARTAALQVGSSYTASLTAPLPNGISGNYFFLVKTDDPNIVFEAGDENNNVRASNTASQIILSPSPDLVVTKVKFTPDTAVRSSQVLLTYTVKNIGAAATSGQWISSVKYSPNSTLDTLDATVLSVAQYAALQAGDSLTRTVILNASSSLGLQYFFVIADAENSQYEHNGESNNVSTAAKLFSIAPSPTLADVELISMTMPFNVMSGESYSFSFKVKNNGPHKTENSIWTDIVFLSVDSFVDASDIILSTNNHIGSLDSGAFYVYNGLVTIPNGTATGNYFLLLKNSGVLNDSLPGNNISVNAISNTLTPPPDLEVINISIPDTVYAKQLLWLHYTVKNNGPGVINSKNITDKIFLGNMPLALTDIMGSRTKIRSVNPGATYTDSVFITMPAYAFAFNYISIKTDFQNYIYENPQEQNNISSKIVFVSQYSGVDLIPVSIHLPKDSFLLGDKMSIDYAITNQGINALFANNRNAIHFSKDKIFNGASDVLFDYKDEMILLQPGDTLHNTISAILKDADADWYYSVLRVNSRATYPEDSMQNNELFSDSLHIDAKELFVNIPESTYLSSGEFLYYKISVPADNDMVITVKQLSGDGQNAAYSSYSKVPKISDAEFVADAESEEDQTLLIPGTQAGTYYLLIRNHEPSLDSQLIEIKARLLPLTILSIKSDEGGQGIVTTTLTGAGFRDTSVVQLKQGTTVFANATIIDRKHSMQMEIRWDLTNVPLGVYDVVITNGNNTAVLPNGFTVEVAEPFKIAITEFRTGSFFMGTPFTQGYAFTNIGNLDIPVTQCNVMLSDDCPLTVYNSSNMILDRDLFSEATDPVPSFATISDYKVMVGYIHDLKPGSVATITMESRIEGSLENPVQMLANAQAMSRGNFAVRQITRSEKYRQLLLRLSLLSYPSLADAFTDRRDYCIGASRHFIDKGFLSVGDIDNALSGFSDNYVDIDPGPQIGIYVDGDIEFKANDLYKWEINIPTTDLGGEAGKPLGWDFIRALNDIHITADSVNKFTIAIIPRNPCDHSYCNLTTWEPWHDYKWPIAYAEGTVIGFAASKFEFDSKLFSDVNDLYGGHFEISVSNDTIYLMFKNRPRLCGELAIDGGPGVCGFPGGAGGPGICTGRGGDGGAGWSAGSAGGAGGSGPGGGGAGGHGGPGAPFGMPGIDTDMDSDGDGISDDIDNCPATPNPGQADQDNDGRGDACDANPNQYEPDDDGDGMPNDQDNCPAAANFSQGDADGDGIGNACDSRPNTPQGCSICPPRLDCPGGQGCPPASPDPSCTNCPPSANPGSPVTGGGGSSGGSSKCIELRKKLKCPEAAFDCMQSTLEIIAAQGGTLDGFSTAGRKNQLVLAAGLAKCAKDLLGDCLGIKSATLDCAVAGGELGKSVLQLEVDLGATNDFLDDCLGIDIGEFLCDKVAKHSSKDPNEIHGPDGIGDTSIRWIPKNSVLPYSIHFENDSLQATAAAKRVVITEDIHPNLDPASFRLGEIFFRNQSFTLPSISNYTGIINLNDSLDYDVEVTAGLDFAHNKIFWVLQAINPLTGLPPNTLNGGFLPVNDALGNGQGFVTYTISPKNTAHTLDTATAQASIIFDVNEPILTNIWKNTIDSGRPSSSIDTLPSFIAGNTIPITLHASDDAGGSGINFVSLLFQTNGGAFTSFGEFNKDDTVSFTGIEGNVYGFYSIAVDSVGNAEPLKTNAQWTVQLGHKDSIEIIQPLSMAHVCEQSTIAVAWTSYKVPLMKLTVKTLNGAVVFTSPVFSSGDSVFIWNLPVLTADTLILKLEDKENSFVFDIDTVLIDHLKTWYLDADADGYYTGSTILACTTPGTGYTTATSLAGDCNDNNNAVHPGALEICGNAIDDDCNGTIDQGCCPACTKAPKKPTLLISGVSSTGTTGKFCPGDTVTVSVKVPEAIACNYIWTPPSGASIISGQGTISVKLLLDSTYTVAGNVSVVVSNTCGSSLPASKIIPRNKNNFKPGAILQSGDAKICPGETRIFSVPVIPDMTFNWLPPAGTNILGGQGTESIEVEFTAAFTASDFVYVNTENACGSSATVKQKAILGTNIHTPGAIMQSGDAKVCPGETRTFSVNAIPGISTFTWTTPAGTNILNGQGMESIEVEFTPGFTATGAVQVVSENGCGQSKASKKNVVFGTKPATPAAISGDITGLCGAINVPYSTTDQGYAYNWFFDSPEAIVNSGQGSASITAGFTTLFTTGALNVTAENGCGVSSVRKLNNIKAIPAAPVVPLGPNTVCFNQMNVAYEIPAVQGASAYTWTAPVQAVISDGIITSASNVLTTSSNAVAIHFGTKSGAVKVMANSACGSSGIKTLNVSLSNCMAPRVGEGNGYIQLFPNPVNDLLNVIFYLPAGQAGPYTVKVYDALGKEALIKQGYASEGSNLAELNVSSLAKGVYQLILENKDNNLTGEQVSYKARFVVE